MKAKALYAEASYDEALAVLKGNDGAEALSVSGAVPHCAGPDTGRRTRARSARSTSRRRIACPTPTCRRAWSACSRRRDAASCPRVVKRLFTEARADFQAKNLASARDKFEKVLTLTHDPAMKDCARRRRPAAARRQLHRHRQELGARVAVQAATPVARHFAVRHRCIAAPASASVRGLTATVGHAGAAVPPASASTPPRPRRQQRRASAPHAASASRAVVPAVTVRQDLPAFHRARASTRGR